MEPHQLHGIYVDRPDVKIARMTASRVEARQSSVMDMHHLVNTARGVEYFVERHELTLFRDDEYHQAFSAAGLDVDVDPEGLIGRGLYFGRRPPEQAKA